MADGYKTAYGLEVSAGRLVLVRAVRRGAAQTALVAASGSEESRRALQAFLAPWNASLASIKTPSRLRWHLEVDPLEF